MKKLKAILSFIFVLGIICLGFSFAFNFETKVTASAELDKNEIIERIATGECVEKGGAIYLSAGSTYNMSGGEISGHFAEKGGAIYIGDGSVFTMTGGTITGNYAKYGGAIYVANGGECYINGGTITGNFAENAPAIYVESGGILEISTTALVDGNEFINLTPTNINVYVDGTLSKTMTKVGDSYTIDESEMPLDYENCCGYFYDEKLSKCTNGVVNLATGEEITFAPRKATTSSEGVNIYTRTANPNNFRFLYNEETDSYDIKAKSTVLTGDIVIPKEYENVKTTILSATTLTEGAFYNCYDMSAITLPDGLKTVSNYAFINSGIEGEMVIPDSVEVIGDSSFYCLDFTGSFLLSDNVKHIGDRSFEGCDFDGDLVIPDGVTYVGYRAFYACQKFDGILTIGNSVETIGKEAFSMCDSLTGSIIIPDNVKSIGEMAFQWSDGFTGDLIIGNGVTEMGEKAFYHCNNLAGRLVLGNSLTTIPNWAFSSMKNITGEIKIPDTVTYIGISAFFECKKLTGNLVIPNSVKTLEMQAFRGCSGLTGDLVIPDNVTSMGNGAFYGCSGFNGTLTISKNITQILENSFINCSSLTGNLVIPSGVTSIGDYAFSSCSGLTGSLIIPDSVTSIGDSAFYSCRGLTGELIIPDSVTIIEYEAFSYCGGLTSVIIGNSVTSIRGGAFSYCSGLTEVKVTNVNTTYEDRGKSAIIEKSTNTIIQGFNCTDLSVLEEVTSIGDDAFAGCSGITSVTIPDSVTSIGNSAFNSCSRLTSVTIPDSVTSIGNSAFYSCSRLTSVIIPNSVTSIGDSVFYGCSGLTSVTIPDSVTSIGNSAFRSCIVLTSVTIPDSVTSIGNSAFNSCSGLTSVIIPDSVTSIGNSAFNSCSRLTSVYIPSTVTTITASSYSNAPFYKCSSSLVIYTDVVNAENVPSGWGTYWNYYNSSNQLEIVYGCSIDSEGNIVTPTTINFYVDGSFHSSMVKFGSSYEVQEEEMPLQYEDCCGYFLDDIYMTTIKNNTIDLTNGDVDLYTRSLESTNVEIQFTYKINSFGKYTIGSDFFSEGIGYEERVIDLVFPREYEDVEITELEEFAFYESFYYTDRVNIYLSSEMSVLGRKSFSTDTGAMYPTIIDFINIHDNIKEIQDLVFAGAGISSIYIPSSVTTISASSYSSSPFYGGSSSLVIYTDVANASSKPSGWSTYWNCKSSSATYTTNYGYTLEQYKSAVGLTFAPNGEEISGAEVETAENVDSYKVDNSYLEEMLLDKKEYIVLPKKQVKIA